MQHADLEYALVASMLVGVVGYLFWLMLLAARQKHMARLMKLTTWAVVVILMAVPVTATIRNAAAWINGTVEKLVGVGEKVSDVTEKIDSVTKDTKGTLRDILRHQLRDPGKD